MIVDVILLETKAYIGDFAQVNQIDAFGGPVGRGLGRGRHDDHERRRRARAQRTARAAVAITIVVEILNKDVEGVHRQVGARLGRPGRRRVRDLRHLGEGDLEARICSS